MLKVQITVGSRFLISSSSINVPFNLHLQKVVSQHLHRQMCGAGTETQQMFSALPVLLIEIHFNFCYGRGSVSEKRDLRA